jgi:undecaprenyl-phosphate 4-deoxy-4-formamido-L-arabinose transferase
MTTSRGPRFSGISVVVPVYNSEGTLRELVTRLESTLAGAIPKLEIVLVNDGSRDRSWDVICQLAQEHNCVRGVNLMRNYGQHNALLCGIRMAENDIVVTMDDDLQNPPEEIPKLLDKLCEGYDVVYGTPQEEQHGLWRNFASLLTKRAMSRAMGIGTIRDISAFRVFKTQLRSAFANCQSPNLVLDVLLSWGTTRFASVKVRHLPRTVGRSNYTFVRLVDQAMFVLTGYSTGPLRVATLLGFTSALFGLGVLAYVIGRYLIEGTSVPGFAFLASTIAIFSGAQLFAIGVIGEYLGRMFNRSMERPTYVIAERFKKSSEQ